MKTQISLLLAALAATLIVVAAVLCARVLWHGARANAQRAFRAWFDQRSIARANAPDVRQQFETRTARLRALRAAALSEVARAPAGDVEALTAITIPAAAVAETRHTAAISH